MIIDSPLSPVAYRAAVRDQLENFRNFRDERFSGRIIGPLFCITHHSYTEWNRRITGEMNNAIGFLRKTDTGCRVHYIHTTGILNPYHLSAYFLLYLVVFFIGLREVSMNDISTGNAILLISLTATVVSALISAVSNALTENGIRGGYTLQAFIEDPTFEQGE